MITAATDYAGLGVFLTSIAGMATAAGAMYRASRAESAQAESARQVADQADRLVNREDFRSVMEEQRLLNTALKDENMAIKRSLADQTVLLGDLRVAVAECEADKDRVNRQLADLERKIAEENR